MRDWSRGLTGQTVAERPHKPNVAGVHDQGRKLRSRDLSRQELVDGGFGGDLALLYGLL